MDQLNALRDTLYLSRRKWEANDRYRKGGLNLLQATLTPEQREEFKADPMSYAHALDMLTRVEQNPSSFSEGKLGRWLGWVQCAATASGALTLDDCKQLNKGWS